MRLSVDVVARLIAVPLVIGLFGVVSSSAANQPSTPPASPIAAPMVTLSVPLFDVSGAEIGRAQLAESGELQVAISIAVAGLDQGEYGVHVHETGLCETDGPVPFASAGNHFDPTEGTHGTPENPESHAGDLSNIVVGPEGEGRLQLSTTKFTISDGPVSLADIDGSSLVIHANRDDMETDPDGNSGLGIICGVIFAPQDAPGFGTPGAATPVS